MKPLRRVAVLGAGTMGSRIAAHFANAGFPVDVLDIEAPFAALDHAAKQKPAAFFTDAARGLVSAGSFDQDLGRVRDAEWIIEAVSEDLAIKRTLLTRVAEHRQPGTILSTNTSGIPLASIVEGFPAELRAHFLGTHFFNPPRYLHLVELIPGPETAPDILRWTADFCDRHLGKGVVPCKDTPNFIGNRIGGFFGATVFKLAAEGGYTVEEVDAITGPLIGLPRSASFRLVDVIGLDVWAHVLRNLYTLAPADPAHDRFAVPDFMEKMIAAGWLGEKRGQGFYKRVGKGAEKEIHAIDRQTLEYHPARKVRFASADAARAIEDLPQRLRAVVSADDRAGRFLWSLFRDLFLYAAAMVPEISDRPVEIDRAMRWGYGFQLGPFEMWDGLGVAETVERASREGYAIPASVERMLTAGAKSFYEAADREAVPGTRYFDLVGADWRPLEPRPGVLVLSDLKRVRGVLRKNAEASLMDLGDGALCLELHGKRNTMGQGTVEMIDAALDLAARQYAALVIAGQGENFCGGTSLMLAVVAAQDGKWDELDAAIRRFQQANMALKYAAKPVVAAPFGMTLGGGCELVLHAARVQASAETYLGLGETGAGLIPSGGGCKEILLRGGDLQAIFERILCGKVSASAAHARELGLLRAEDGVSMNAERLLADARSAALALVPAYGPGTPCQDIAVAGDAGYASLKMGLRAAREAGTLSEYDTVVGEKLAYVLTGGAGAGERRVSEQYLLDLEREAFLSLCGQAKTQERIESMLKTGRTMKN